MEDFRSFQLSGRTHLFDRLPQGVFFPPELVDQVLERLEAFQMVAEWLGKCRLGRFAIAGAPELSFAGLRRAVGKMVIQVADGGFDIGIRYIP